MKPKSSVRYQRVQLMITDYQKEFLESLGSQRASEFVRKLLDSQINSHEVEIRQLKDEIEKKKMDLNLSIAKLSELETEMQLKQAANKTREQLIDEIANRIIKTTDYQMHGLNHPNVKIFIRNNVSDANLKLNGNCDHVTVQEVSDYIIKKEKVNIHNLKLNLCKL